LVKLVSNNNFNVLVTIAVVVAQLDCFVHHHWEFVLLYDKQYRSGERPATPTRRNAPTSPTRQLIDAIAAVSLSQETLAWLNRGLVEQFQPTTTSGCSIDILLPVLFHQSALRILLCLRSSVANAPPLQKEAKTDVLTQSRSVDRWIGSHPLGAVLRR
jgi:hypothetical protein